CHVTILNISDHLGKFDGKADEGYIVGETMNLRYLEEKPNVQGLGHEWYFDLDYLTDTLSYKRDKANQSAGTQEASTNHAGTQASFTRQYHVFKLSSKLFANMKLNFEGQPMPLIAGVRLMLWGDLQVLMDSQAGGKGSLVWNHQSHWQIRSWRLYTLSNVHVLDYCC
ncbi:hypothetical protein Tco_0230244, partial [Tanacetum coccineum]